MTVAWDIPEQHSAGRVCRTSVSFLQSGLVAMGLFLCWWGGDRGVTITPVTRGAPSWAVLVRLGQPAGGAGAKVAVPPLHEQSAGIRAPRPVGRDENPKGKNITEISRR